MYTSQVSLRQADAGTTQLATAKPLWAAVTSAMKPFLMPSQSGRSCALYTVDLTADPLVCLETLTELPSFSEV